MVEIISESKAMIQKLIDVSVNDRQCLLQSINKTRPDLWQIKKNDDRDDIFQNQMVHFLSTFSEVIPSKDIKRSLSRATKFS